MSSGDTQQRIYLNVPFVQKDIVKRLGARFDFDKKSWYIEAHQDASLFSAWLSPEHTQNKITSENSQHLPAPFTQQELIQETLKAQEKHSAITSFKPSAHQSASESELPAAFSLLHLMQVIRQSIESKFSQPIWVHAEIAQIKKHKQHHYLDLVQRGEDKGEELTKVRATIWQSQQHIILDFNQQTGKNLEPNLKVLLQVHCTFHERYGLSLNILKINADYTLGQMQRKINAIRKKLQSKGIYTQNKEKRLPKVLQKICVISPENAAGLADFQHYITPLIKHQLCQCDYYSAIFQGENAEQSIRQCWQEITSQNHHKNYQLIVIIRGGGSIVDLQSLEEYEINELVCLANVPVWVGLGHQTDKLLINEVAHRHFPTPTAVAEHIVEHVLAPLHQSIRHWQEIKLLSIQRISNEMKKIEQQHSSLRQYSQRISQKNQQRLTVKYTALQIHAKKSIHKLRESIEVHAKQVHKLSTQHIKDKQKTLETLQKNVQTLSLSQLQKYKINLRLAHSILEHSHPKKILKKGFAIIKNQHNNPLKDLHHVRQQSDIIIEMEAGQVEATIKTINQPKPQQKP